MDGEEAPSAKSAAAASSQPRYLAKEPTWTSSTDTEFDGTYRHILFAASGKAGQNA